MKPGTMRLLIAEPNSSNGTETVSLGVIPELLHLAECVVWALPSHRAEFYQKLLPASDRLIYEDIYWAEPAGFLWRAHGLLRRLDSLVPSTRIVSWMRAQLNTARLRQLIRKHRLTHFFTTWIFDVDCPRLPVPLGAMAMDLNWQRFPENFPDRDRASLDRRFEDWLARADVVFPISDFTADEMRRAFPNSTRHLKVVPHGAQVLAPIDAVPSPLPHSPSGQETLPRKYFYYPASAFAHKDHGTAVAAAIELYARGYDFDLIFSGARTEAFLAAAPFSNAWTESMRTLLEKNAALIQGRIKILGTIERAKVDELFTGARAIILPSRFEGFGLPLLEAIERGARAICTDIPPFLEQIRLYNYGDYARVFPAGAVDRLAALMEVSLKSPTEGRLLPQQIAARTQRWTWKDVATAYVEALQEAGNRPAP
jgi:glycosyltransferase involved in cell wall biosynthesis